MHYLSCNCKNTHGFSFVVQMQIFGFQAYLQMVKLEQQHSEAERMREAEEKKKQKEKALRVVRMLEAAFDGDTMEIRVVLKEVYIGRLDTIVDTLCQSTTLWHYMPILARLQIFLVMVITVIKNVTKTSGMSIK